MLDEEVVRKACALELFSEYVFLDRQLLFDAVVSKGYPNEHYDIHPVYRQALLANMGDVVIDILATEHLIRHRGITDAGELTKERERMVKGNSLSKLAMKNEWTSTYIAMTSGERNELHHSSTPAESFEAMVGALYLDGGLLAARVFMTKMDFFKKKMK
jgi:ribonuclease-3